MHSNVRMERAVAIDLYRIKGTRKYLTFDELSSQTIMAEPDMVLETDAYEVFATLQDLNIVYCFNKDRKVVMVRSNVADRKEWAGCSGQTIHQPFADRLVEAGYTAMPTRKAFLKVMEMAEDRTEEGLIAQFVKHKEEASKRADQNVAREDNRQNFTDKHPGIVVGVDKNIERNEDGSFTVQILFMSTLSYEERTEYVSHNQRQFIQDVIDYISHNRLMMRTLKDMDLYRPKGMVFMKNTPEAEMTFVLKDPQ